jgi:hypothetical protein
MKKGYGLVLYRSAWTDYDDWAQKYGLNQGDFDVWASGMSLFSFFEGLGTGSTWANRHWISGRPDGKSFS